VCEAAARIDGPQELRDSVAGLREALKLNGAVGPPWVDADGQRRR
jgi:hypothetical protein